LDGRFSFLLVALKDPYEFFEVCILLDLMEGSMQDDAAILDDDDLINQVKKVDGVRHQNARLLGKLFHEDRLKDLLFHVCI